MADMMISPNRYRTIQRQAKQQDEKNAAKQAPAQSTARPAPPRTDRQQLGQAVLSQVERWMEQNENQKTMLDWMTPKKKKPTPEQIELRTQNIRSKLRAGARLSSEDRNFLAQYAPAELGKMELAQRMRAALKAQLQTCRTREEATKLYVGASGEADGVDSQDPDLSGVIRGQLNAAMREAGGKPMVSQVERAQESMSERRQPQETQNAQQERRREKLIRHYKEVGEETEEIARRRCEARG